MQAMNHRRAFTLVELVVVVAILGILAALLLPALSRAKGQGQSVACKNHLGQIGRAMTMYVSDYNIYPSAGLEMRWAEQLAPYNPLPWTNLTWHCPAYLAEGGVVEWRLPPRYGGSYKLGTSYSYNGLGMVGSTFVTSGSIRDGFLRGPSLGLGDFTVRVAIHDQQVLAPSQMYAVGDARPRWQPNANDKGYFGWPMMQPWNTLFAF